MKPVRTYKVSDASGMPASTVDAKAHGVASQVTSNGRPQAPRVVQPAATSGGVSSAPSTPTDYPASWQRRPVAASGVRQRATGATRTVHAAEDTARLMAAARDADHSRMAREQVRDRHTDPHHLIAAAGDNAARLAAARASDAERMQREQAARFV